MDKRFFLALLLAAAVIAITPILFPSPPRPAVQGPGKEDSSRLATVTHDSLVSPVITQRDTGPAVPLVRDSATSAFASIDTAAIETPLARYTFSTLGASPVDAVLNRYQNRRHLTEPVKLTTPGKPLLQYRLVLHGDTIPLSGTNFTVSRVDKTVRYQGIVNNVSVSLSYTPVPNSYLVRVQGDVQSSTGEPLLLIDLPSSFRETEADTLDDQRNLAFSYKLEKKEANSVLFSKLDPGEQFIEPAPLTWVAAKSKYFVVGMLAREQGRPFGGIHVTGGPRVTKHATQAFAVTTVPLQNGRFDFDLYLGPQAWEQLNAVGRDFEHVHPYGWALLQGIVQPMARIVIRALLWMHRTLDLSYGWVLVIFGVAVRLLLWPLNQGAMRSSLKMQELQPKITDIQKRYQHDRVKQQEEILRVYKEAGTTPFAALSGCLPMFIPMPILFALFFVFQSTIEFRGVPFLWLTDISTKDPFYVLPILMGISSYLLSWIGTRNAPPNPQAKVMSYTFPVMMTVLLLNMAAGLNLYYTVQNIAALPQQWLIARERKKARPNS